MEESQAKLINLTRPQCADGLIVPSMRTTTSAAVLYLFGLLYCFLGIAIVADIFMCAIERITSTTRKVAYKNSRQVELVADELSATTIEGYEVRVWNSTVANLTLMALGSSAPEILLSVIEIVGNSFIAGDLGPGTIVGSAAFNLFCITAVCVVTVPSPGAKRIKRIAVFAVTTTFSCIAYLWLLIILSIISPNVVEVWEALITLGFFVALIIFAYLADLQIWRKSKKPSLEKELAATDHGDQQVLLSRKNDINSMLKKVAIQLSTGMTHQSAAGARESMRLASRWLTRRYPWLTLDELSRLLAQKLENVQACILRLDRDRLWYRIQASRYLSASLKKLDPVLDEKKFSDKVDKAVIAGRTVEFSARVYSITRGRPNVTLKIVRHGSLDQPLTFSYSTVNGVAKKDLHYLPKFETMQFKSGESVKEINVEILDSYKWRPNYVFYVHLKMVTINAGIEKASLGRTNIASVRAPDDSASFVGEPMVQFVETNYVVKESEKFVRAFVTRLGRHDRCSFVVRYETESVTAKSGEDFVPITDGQLRFDGDEYEKYVDVRVYDDLLEEKDESFIINLISSSGVVTIGPNKRTVVTIICDDNIIKNITNIFKLTSHYLKMMTFGVESWKDQLIEACSVNAGDLVNATLCDCLLHIVSFPWKILVALIPPITIFSGWLCFFCALALIGLITAIVGDLASIFGCMVGLKDTITAITLVALGTSLPDTFASKFAAQSDDTADNAIGNITGSNAVNVFLGLGLPWTIAAIYWATKNQSFVVNAGNLGFSVAIFMVMFTICVILLIARRMLTCFGRGELGGPIVPKLLSALLLILLWLAYVTLSAMQAYGIISI